MPSKSLPLILARELASNLSTPMFLLDGEGMLVYCNDAAELLIGRSMAELGELTGLEFGEQIDLRHSDGTPMSGADSPAGVAFFERRPAHRRVRCDRVRRHPPRSRRDLVSAVRRARSTCTVSSRCSGRWTSATETSDARTRVGLSRFARGARARHGALRRQHELRRGRSSRAGTSSSSTPAPACARSASR